jgi:hypothetical protein
MSHPFNKAGIREDSLFLQYFATLGEAIDSTSAVGAELRLYDLSDASARTATASYVPTASRDSSSASMGCTGAVAR